MVSVRSDSVMTPHEGWTGPPPSCTLSSPLQTTAILLNCRIPPQSVSAERVETLLEPHSPKKRARRDLRAVNIIGGRNSSHGAPSGVLREFGDSFFEDPGRRYR